jgi:hypothetical protein
LKQSVRDAEKAERVGTGKFYGLNRARRLEQLIHCEREVGFDMKPYAMLASGNGASTSSALAARLATWHDAMVAHERRLRTGRTGDVCDDECPHVEARTLWAEALAAFGERAHELSFLRSRATNNAQPIANTVGPRSRESERANHERPSGGERTRAVRDSRGRPVTSPTLRPRHMMTEAEL